MKRSSSEMYDGKDEDGVDGSGNESSMSGLLMANKLLYHFPHDFSVVTNATKKESLFASRLYNDGETMMCTVMTGADFVDPLRSYLSFDVDAKLTGPGYWWEHSHVGYGANNTACNFIRSIVVKSRSGDELMRTNNFNVLCAHKMMYVYDKGWWDTVGSTLTQVQQTACTTGQLAELGRETEFGSDDKFITAGQKIETTQANQLKDRSHIKTWVTGRHRVNIPLYCLGGIFATDKLLPQNLCAGMVIQINLAPARDVYVWHSQKSRMQIPKALERDLTVTETRWDNAYLQTNTAEASETRIRDSDEWKTSADALPTKFTVDSNGVLSIQDAANNHTVVDGVQEGDVFLYRNVGTSLLGYARVEEVIVGSAGEEDGEAATKVQFLLNNGPIPITANGQALVATTNELYHLSRAAFERATRVAVDSESKLRAQVGTIDPTPEEERQMRFAMTRQDLIANDAFGFTSSNAPHRVSTASAPGAELNSSTAFGSSDFSTSYVVTVPRLILHCNQLTDATQRAVNATSAHNGLEIVYYDYENTQAPDTGLEAHIEVKKAVSRAMKAIAVVRPKPISDTNALTGLKTHTNTFACLPFNVKEYQWQLGALYYPHQRIEGRSAGTNNGIAFTSGMAYNEALDCFSSFAPKRTYSNVSLREFQGLTVGYQSKFADGRFDDDRMHFRHPPSVSALVKQNRKSQYLDPTYRCNGVIAQGLERSGIFELSGLPINNSRVLSLHMTMDASDINDEEATKFNVDVFLKYVKVARVFMQMVEVES